jgi:hypothetical protein
MREGIVADDRFDDPNTYKKAERRIVMDKRVEPISWADASTLEQWMRKALAEGKDSDVVALLRNLPLEKREKYRMIWAEIKNGRQKQRET